MDPETDKNNNLPHKPKTRAGRPRTESGRLRYELHYKQMALLKRIQKASRLSAPAIIDELEFDHSVRNKGKTWRDWVAGRTLCNMLDAVVEKSRAKGWVDDKAEALYQYMRVRGDAAKEASDKSMQFRKAQRRLVAALAEFRQICEQEHNAKVDELIPAISIHVGEDKDSHSSFPLQGEQLEVIFEKAESAVAQLAQLSLESDLPQPQDPETGKRFTFGFEYASKPQQG